MNPLKSLLSLALLGGAIMGVKALVKGDDVVSPGYGKRAILSPEGTIKLNDKDTIIAGTDLGGDQPNPQNQPINQTPIIPSTDLSGGQPNTQNQPINQTLITPGTDLKGDKQQSIQGPAIDLTPMIAAINEVKAAVDGLINRPVVINMDGKQVGSNLVQGSYKLA